MADTAVKVSVKKIETDSSLNKINIMGTVVNQARREEGNAIVVDDGSSVIDVLIFDNTVNNAQVGDLVQVIGNVGTIEGKKVIAGQIVKRLDNRRWLELRRLELGSALPEKQDVSSRDVSSQGSRIAEEAKPDDSGSPAETILGLIRKLDSGKGANVDLVVRESRIETAEKLINSLLEEGEIFEIRPGMLKVLE